MHISGEKKKNESASAIFEKIHIFNISGVGLFLMKSTFTVLIQIEDRGLNGDIGLVNPLRSWTLKT